MNEVLQFFPGGHALFYHSPVDGDHRGLATAAWRISTQGSPVSGGEEPLKIRWDFVDGKKYTVQLFPPHVLEPLSGVQHHVIESLGAGAESGEIGKHQFSAQSTSMTVAPAPPETPYFRTGVFLGLTAIGVSPPDIEPGNMWL